MTDFLAILRRNFISPIVIAILVLASILLALGEQRDAWFISFVIILNTSLAIIQEVRAQRELRKLELLSAPRARRQLENGTFEDIMYDELLVGDVIEIRTGDEIAADGIISQSAGLEADESMLTGESAAVEKDTNATVYAGSAVVAGRALIKVTAVGLETKAGKMTATLKRYTPQLTPLQHAISRAITLLTYGAIFLAVLIFAVYYAAGADAIKIFKTITSAAVTVVPEGLLLASSLLLAYGSLKLTRAKVLPQKLAAIEAMALLSVLCVDKTGTLTSDTVTFDDFLLFDKHTKDAAKWQDLVGIVALATSKDNATGEAIIAALPVPKEYDVKEILAFSSERKMSGARAVYKDKTHTLLIGAPEFLSTLAPLSTAQREQVKTLTSEGMRVLLVASFDDQKHTLKTLPTNSGTPIGLIVLSNALRDGVEKTVTYLQNNNVSIRVISGDNPQTVQYIATKAGIKNTEKLIMGVDLAKLSDTQWNKTVLETTIFARVLPEQKERLISTFQENGSFTGMVGDGVNDALALKKADLGVAMYAGAAASRRVADIVLLNNSFTSLPIGMKLGDRIMQAIELLAVLFFHKIIFGVVLLLTTLAIGLAYPFDPRHVTFMNIFLVTMPTIMWTLFPPHPLFKVQPQYFWRDTLQAVIPIAILSGVTVSLTYWILLQLFPDNLNEVVTATVVTATFFGVYLVFLVSRMLGAKQDASARLAKRLYVGAVLLIALICFEFMYGFFDFTPLNITYLWPALLISILPAFVQYLLAVRIGDRLEKSRRNG
jgi:cation-transporting ATPase E